MRWFRNVLRTLFSLALDMIHRAVRFGKRPISGKYTRSALWMLDFPERLWYWMEPSAMIGHVPGRHKADRYQPG
jgi:hypothetical protein